LNNPCVKRDLPLKTMGWIILYLFSPIDNIQMKSLKEIKRFLFLDKIRYSDSTVCYLDNFVVKAKERNHPDNVWINDIYEVFCKFQDISILDKWEKWKNITFN
jgi:hypothetical protein